jgi:hypothetical protein
MLVSLWKSVGYRQQLQLRLIGGSSMDCAGAPGRWHMQQPALLHTRSTPAVEWCRSSVGSTLM